METYFNKAGEIFSYLIHPPAIYAVGVVIVFLVVLLVIQSYRRTHRPITPFNSQGGKVEIAPQTLKGVINHAVSSVEGVERAGCKHQVKGRRLAISVGIHLLASAKLKTVETEIKKRIRSVLKEQFGMETVDPINIRVNRIIGDPSLSTESALEDDDSAEEIHRLEVDEDDDDDRPYAEETKV